MVATLVPEAASSAVRARLRRLVAGEAVVSDWVTAEVSSALSMKLRTGALTPGRRATALAAYQGLLAASLTVLRVSSEHFQAAARYADHHDLGLRAADALHLALCADHGATMLTLDRRLHAACLALGVAVEGV